MSVIVYSMGLFGIIDVNGVSMDMVVKSVMLNLNARTALSASAIRGYNIN